jgi:CRISPR-associated protein Cas8b1/Cst1 subtype I-B
MPLFNPNIEVDALTKQNAELLHSEYKFTSHLSRMVAVEWTEKHNCKITGADISYNDENAIYLMYLTDENSNTHFYKADANLPLTISEATPQDIITFRER